MDEFTRINEELTKLQGEIDALGSNVLSGEDGDNGARIAFLSGKLKFLKDELDFIKGKSQPIPEKHSAMQEIPMPGDRPIPNPASQYVPYTVPPHGYVPYTAPPKGFRPDVKPVKEGNIEATVGKAVMAVAASLLIFIGLIIFATALFPLASDAIKLGLIFLFGIILTTVGFRLLNKQKNAFSLSLCGCGLGSIYIGIFLANVLFKFVDDIGMYVLLFCWGVGMSLITRLRKELMFKITGHMGILISVIFGSALCSENGDTVKFTLICIYFAVTYILFYAINFKKEYSKTGIDFQAGALSLAVLTITSMSFENIAPLLTILLLINVALFALPFFINEIDNETVFGIISIEYIGLYILLLAKLDLGRDMLKILVLLFTYMAIALCELRLMSKKQAATIVECGSIAIGSFALLLIGTEVLPLLIIPFIIYGAYREKRLFSCFALGLSYIWLFTGINNSNLPLYVAFGVGIIALFTVAMYHKPDFYASYIKWNCYIILLIFIARVAERAFNGIDHDALYTFLTVSLVHLICSACGVVKKLGTVKEEKDVNIALYAINALLMFISLVWVTDCSSEPLHSLVVLCAVALFCVNGVRLLKKYPNFGYYIGIKLTVLLYVVLDSYSVMNYAISICFFIFAILLITLGFLFEYRSLRIYSLVIALISIIKLVLIDIVYSNTITKSASFIVCGVLCFMISFIYHYAEKNLITKE